MKLTFVNTQPDKEQFSALYQTTGWHKGYRFSQDQFEESLSRSWHMISAYHDDRLVGFGRVISDGILHALITEMIVLPEYRGQGIGGRILEKLVEKCLAHNPNPFEAL